LGYQNTMSPMAKQEYIVQVKKRYKQAINREEKGALINEVMVNLDIHRKSAIRTLKRKTKRYITPSPGKQRIYGDDLILPLSLLWKVGGCPCSKRLEPQIGELLDKLKEFHEITLYGKQEALLRKMKSSTIDKLLEGEKDISKKEYGLSGTKKSPLLKTLIPVRTYFSSAEYQEPGHIEMDCVLHCGESLIGTYAETLNLIDIASHWNEKKIFLKKTKAKIVGAIHMLRRQFPVPILSIDFDNGVEFVNWLLHTYCKKEGVTFTRCRSYHKNDQAHIEGKNYQSVRRVTGYDRITEERIVEVIDDMYQNEHRLLTNFFYTTLKLKEKKREEGKITKKHERAQTPYQRLLLSDKISQETKDKLKQQYAQLNPAELQRKLQKKLHNIQLLMKQQKNIPIDENREVSFGNTSISCNDPTKDQLG
jgi:hypothetical protein